MLPLQGAQVRSLLTELRAHMSHDTAKKTKTKRKEKEIDWPGLCGHLKGLQTKLTSLFQA